MQIIKSFIKLFVFVCPFTAAAQSTYLTQGSKEYHFIERLEIKQQRNTNLNFSALKPFNRKAIVTEAMYIDSSGQGYKDSAELAKYNAWADLDLSKVDRYNLRSLFMNNSEWVNGPMDYAKSKRPILKTFYTTKPNLLEVNTKDFFLVVNPVLQLQYGKETGYNKNIYVNSKGVTVRGRIANKIGFSSTITDNQERGPRFFQQYINKFKAVPGVGFYKPFKAVAADSNKIVAADYFDARGYITFTAAKYIDLQFGYDKNFIGDGYRSLFLSDWGNSYLFLKLNTKIWKLNYQNIFMELIPQFNKRFDSLFSRKYAAIHHLSMNVTRWLNLGLFESVVFGRKDHFDFQYLNPIIFYRHIEGTIGSPDNALAGFDFKANILHRVQLYGQFLLDEFILSKIKNSPTNWVNKFGIQVGAKYVDAFGLKNLDLQVEVNRVRPFTYSHKDSIANYTHYNQPLAHPLGANFQEVIGIVNYQPFPKWFVNAKMIYYYQGLDSAGLNYGSDPFRDYRTRSMEEGYKIGSGNKATCFNGILNVTYELRENIFLDATLQQRNYKLANVGSSSNSTMFSAGIRMNIAKRQYDF
ncbi:MAG: capsule assembly Wzi family protein [Ferruginibacter sp.]